MNGKYTIIFIGPSGCGKGTQVGLLQKYMEENDQEKRSVFYLESGKHFRDFISQSGYTAKLSKKVMNTGELQPSFLAVHVWSHLMIEQMDDNKHLIIDGTPRLLDEAKVLDGAFSFYGIEKVFVIHFNVSDDWSRERLSERGRFDDKDKEEVEKRLTWYKKEVLPIVDYFRDAKRYEVLDINGEQTIEEVHQDIIKQIF
ncbi:nucleoside monophosphate kinase [Candidatus Nomurabacteria bacterium]|nr:nucleoside monophosphate kinase [Candidatus Nomurabacteria bacterium]USN94791.1 MAG: nucleoside monophosphate kinase [Candidatus Nomurabacteria bacterium]